MEAEESASGKSGVVSYASTIGTPTSRPVKGGVSCLSSVETVSLNVHFMHWPFEIECDNRASQATELIHPELARGHSNLLEASYNVLIRFRSKNLTCNVCTTYLVSTNLGLLQSNMTWLMKKRGITSH